MCACACLDMYMPQRVYTGQVGVNSLLHHEGPGDQTQIIRLGIKATLPTEPPCRSQIVALFLNSKGLQCLILTFPIHKGEMAKPRVRSTGTQYLPRWLVTPDVSFAGTVSLWLDHLCWLSPRPAPPHVSLSDLSAQ